MRAACGFEHPWAKRQAHNIPACAPSACAAGPRTQCASDIPLCCTIDAWQGCAVRSLAFWKPSRSYRPMTVGSAYRLMLATSSASSMEVRRSTAPRPMPTRCHAGLTCAAFHRAAVHRVVGAGSRAARLPGAAEFACSSVAMFIARHAEHWFEYRRLGVISIISIPDPTAATAS